MRKSQIAFCNNYNSLAPTSGIRWFSNICLQDLVGFLRQKPVKLWGVLETAAPGSFSLCAPLYSSKSNVSFIHAFFTVVTQTSSPSSKMFSAMPLIHLSFRTFRGWFPLQTTLQWIQENHWFLVCSPFPFVRQEWELPRLFIHIGAEARGPWFPVFKHKQDKIPKLMASLTKEHKPTLKCTH